MKKRKLFMHCFLLIVAIVMIVACHQPEKKLFFSGSHFSIDKEQRLLIVLATEIRQENNIAGIWLENTYYEFLEEINLLKCGIPYMVQNKKEEIFSLFLSELPLIHLYTDQPSINKTLTKASFLFKEMKLGTIQSYAAINVRGAHTSSYPKKSIRLTLYQDENLTQKNNLSFCNMREDEDWILQAMYNEPLRLRDKTSHELWLQIGQITADKKSWRGKNGLDMNYVELFLNDAYQGVYVLSERMDRKQLQLKKEKNSSKRGELIKGKGYVNTVFKEITPPPINDTLVWGSFYYKYPKDNVSWTDLHDFIQFVINSDENSFDENLPRYLDIDNTINYFIFLNVLSAYDNTGKNIYLAKHDQNHPYFYIPWDLDAVFGNDFTGSRRVDRDSSIISNYLFDRMFLNQNSPFRASLLHRWEELKQHKIISSENIQALINTNYKTLLNNGVYLRETLKWDEYTFNKNDLIILHNWISDRINYMDHVFKNELFN